MQWLDNNHDLFGQWRIEVSPGGNNQDDFFLHLLQVADTSLQSMANSTPIKTGNMLGVRFDHKNHEYDVKFLTTNEAGGRISIHQNGKKILEEDLSSNVKPQKGLY